MPERCSRPVVVCAEAETKAAAPFPVPLRSDCVRVSRIPFGFRLESVFGFAGPHVDSSGRALTGPDVPYPALSPDELLAPLESHRSRAISIASGDK
jgi:hypothetical protein